MLIVIALNNDDNEHLLYKVVEEIFKKFKYICISLVMFTISFVMTYFSSIIQLKNYKTNVIVLQYTVLFVIITIKISKIYRN